jgi:ABC-2 type transport system permease protein
VVGALVFDINYPSIGDALVFVVSVALAVVISLAFRFLYNSAAFWLLDYRGVANIAITVSLFFSGMLLPLRFFPHWLALISHALPFQAIIQVPIDIYLGKHHGAALVGVLALQVAWALALLGLARLVLEAGTRKLVIQGG